MQKFEDLLQHVHPVPPVMFERFFAEVDACCKPGVIDRDPKSITPHVHM